jgi:hypothetical protein
MIVRKCTRAAQGYKEAGNVFGIQTNNGHSCSAYTLLIANPARFSKVLQLALFAARG